MAEKTEKATPKKLRDARKKGQVAKAQDFPSAVTFIVAVSVTLYLAGFLFKQLGGFMSQMFTVAPSADLSVSAPFYLKEMINVILISSLPILALVAFVGVIVSFFSGRAHLFYRST